MEMLTQYFLAGNIRELENLVERFKHIERRGPR